MDSIFHWFNARWKFTFSKFWIFKFLKLFSFIHENKFESESQFQMQIYGIYFHKSQDLRDESQAGLKECEVYFLSLLQRKLELWSDLYIMKLRSVNLSPDFQQIYVLIHKKMNLLWNNSHKWYPVWNKLTWWDDIHCDKFWWINEFNTHLYKIFTKRKLHNAIETS